MSMVSSGYPNPKSAPINPNLLPLPADPRLGKQALYHCDIILHCSTSWHTQPYTRGSYTAIAVGASQIDIELLAQPLYSKQNQAKVS